jgi:molecular chaperone DnaJ
MMLNKMLLFGKRPTPLLTSTHSRSFR